MRALGQKKSAIGEGPQWNDREQRLYVTNGLEREILLYSLDDNTVEIRKTPVSCAALCFSNDNRCIVSHDNGVSFLESDNSLTPLYDRSRYTIRHANDMKIGPNGRIYVGTQSEKRLGLSDKTDGKLYSIDNRGQVRLLLDGLRLSNGLDWSPDESRFYHTDSDTEILKEYRFFKFSGDIEPTGRAVSVPGVDGLCVAENGEIYAACWGKGCVAVVDPVRFAVRGTLPLPVTIPASCAFAGKNLEHLAITTASYGADSRDKNAGLTFLHHVGVRGKASYRFAWTASKER